MDNNKFKSLENKVADLEKTVNELVRKLTEKNSSTFQSSTVEIINHKVQFLQDVFDKNGAKVTEINP